MKKINILLSILGIYFLINILLDWTNGSVFLSPIVILIVYYAYTHKQKKKKNPNNELPQLTPEKLAHYKEMGISYHELTFFRQTINETKQQIIRLEKNMNQSTKLSTINLRNDTVSISKSFFKELVKNPQRLHSANHFLYHYLPDLVELTDQYLEIENTDVKNKQLYNKLEESAEAIDQVAQSIKKEYEDWISVDLNQLDVKVSIAKNNLNPDNES